MYNIDIFIRKWVDTDRYSTRQVEERDGPGQTPLISFIIEAVRFSLCLNYKPDLCICHVCDGNPRLPLRADPSPSSLYYTGSLTFK